MATNAFICRSVEGSTFKGKYYEVMTDGRINRQLDFAGTEEYLQGHKIVMTAVVGYSDFEEDFCMITDYLYDDIDFLNN